MAWIISEGDTDSFHPLLLTDHPDTQAIAETSANNFSVDCLDLPFDNHRVRRIATSVLIYVMTIQDHFVTLSLAEDGSTLEFDQRWLEWIF